MVETPPMTHSCYAGYDDTKQLIPHDAIKKHFITILASEFYYNLLSITILAYSTKMMAGISKTLDENPKPIDPSADDSITLFNSMLPPDIKPTYIRTANSVLFFFFLKLTSKLVSLQYNNHFRSRIQ